MQKSCKVISVLFKHSLLFFLYNPDSPQLDQSLLFHLSLFLLLSLSVLLQFDLPQFLNFSSVLLFFHPFLLASHLIQLFLFCHSLQHFQSKLFFQIFLLLFLFLFHFLLLSGCFLQKSSKLFFLFLFFFILFLELLFIQKLIILHPDVLQLFKFFFTLFFSSFQLQIDLFFLLLLPLHFLFLKSVSLVEFALVLSYFLQFGSICHFYLHSHLFFCFVLFDHDIIQISFLQCLLLSVFKFLIDEFLNLSIHYCFLFFIFFSRLALKIFSILDLGLQYSQIVSLFFFQLFPFSLPTLCLSLGCSKHFCLFLRLQSFCLQISDLLFCDLFGSFFGHIRNINFFPHGLDFWISSYDGINHVLFELLFNFKFSKLLCQLLVVQFHVQILNMKVNNFTQRFDRSIKIEMNLMDGKIYIWTIIITIMFKSNYSQ